MRLDNFLKISRIIPRRSLAQKFCDAGLVSVNSVPAKSSREVKINDLIELKRNERLLKFRVLAVPVRKQLSKDKSEELFELISNEPQPDAVFSNP